jgi:hypothetical protein
LDRPSGREQQHPKLSFFKAWICSRWVERPSRARCPIDGSLIVDLQEKKGGNSQMKAKRTRALELKVAEVDEILASLADARTLKDLNGRQRQQLQEAYEDVDLVRRTAIGETAEVPVDVLLQILRCASMTQRWLREMFVDFSVVKTNE